MQIKITAKTPNWFKEIVSNVLNIAGVVAGFGYIPKPEEMEEPERTGRYWYLDPDGTKYHLLPATNNWLAHIRAEGENFVVLEFWYRHDKNNLLSDALANLILARFPNHVEVW